MEINNIEQLKKLKELFDSGAISQEEFDKMRNEFLRESMANDGVLAYQKKTGFALFLSRNKFLLSFIGLLLIGGIFLFFYLQPDLDLEAKKFSEKAIAFEQKNNEEYIRRLNDFILDYELKDYRTIGQVDKDFTQIQNEYNKHTLTADLAFQYRQYKEDEKKIKMEWSKNSKSGKSFWKKVDTYKLESIELSDQNNEIEKLESEINERKNKLKYGSSSDISNRKNEIYSKLNSFYSNKEEDYFDAYDYFSYHVEQYLLTKNTTPTEINLINKRVGDYTNKETRLIEETLQLKQIEKEYEYWTYSTEFKCFRPSMEKYQICNVWYEVKLNKKSKIVSYKEIRTENKRLMSAEEYNNLFNSNPTTYETEEQEEDW